MAISVRMSNYKGEKLTRLAMVVMEITSCNKRKKFISEIRGNTKSGYKEVSTRCISVGIVLRENAQRDFSPDQEPLHPSDVIVDVGRLKDTEIFGSWQRIRDDSLPWKF